MKKVQALFFNIIKPKTHFTLFMTSTLFTVMSSSWASPRSKMHHSQILIIFLILNWLEMSGDGPAWPRGTPLSGNWWRLTLWPRHLIKYGNFPPLLSACVGTDDELMSAVIMRCEEYPWSVPVVSPLSVVCSADQSQFIFRCVKRDRVEETIWHI